MSTSSERARTLEIMGRRHHRAETKRAADPSGAACRRLDVVLAVLLSFALWVVGCGGGKGPAGAPDSGGANSGEASMRLSDAAWCTALTCPIGCCDTMGRCQSGSSANACGTQGQACQDCVGLGFPSCDPALHDCSTNVGPCSASNCMGCCAQDLCYPGNSLPTCGSGGQVCESCASNGLACLGQQCAEPCGQGTCAGCCAGNACVLGDAPNACGQYGSPCTDCTALGAICVSEAGLGGACEVVTSCTSGTCPMGCCDANGACQPGTGNGVCGSGGAACQSCPATATCLAQQCVPVCNAQTCPSGCCDTYIQGPCKTGTSDSECGQNGQICDDCLSNGLQCTNQFCIMPTCSSCPNGCCDDLGQCQPGTSNVLCGAGGALCQNCSLSGDECSDQACGPSLGAVCNLQTCPSGCCDSAGHCQQGLTSTVCGSSGSACQNCLQSDQICAGQQCVGGVDAGLPCASCLSGCCDVSGVCEPGTMDTQCGSDGTPCVDCAQSGGVCDYLGQCTEPDGSVFCPQSCSGCCDANGHCQLGYADDQCGQQGANCEDCTALVPPSTCDLSVAPRVCTSQQTQCPAAYPSCPSGLEQAVFAAPNSCSTGELADAAAACAGGPSTQACDAFFEFELASNAACAQCLQPFDVAFAAQSGIRACVAPYVDAPCNHNSACIVDCTTQSCTGCVDDESTVQCDTQVQSGVCSAFAPMDSCVTQALQGPAILCNPSTYQGNFGAWLQAVGAQTCGP